MAKKMLTRDDIVADIKAKYSLVPAGAVEMIANVIAAKVLKDKEKISAADYEEALRNLTPADILKK